MKPWQDVFRRARRSLLTLVASALLMLGVYGAASHLASQAQDQLAQLQQLHTEAQEALQARQTDLSDLRQGLSQFHRLQERGLVGEAQREAWVEQLNASRADLALPDTLSYTLAAARPLAADGQPLLESEVGLDPPPTGAAHDLSVEITGIHEQDLLDWLQRYQDQVAGRFRVNACRLTQPTSTGFTAQCTLRFFTLALPADGWRPSP